MTDDHEDVPEDLAEAAARYLGIDIERYPRRRRERLVEAWRTAEGDRHEALREALCVGETMFLRHPEHFDTLRAVTGGLPGYGREGVRAWSAGCATGEEAYTLAATLKAVCGEHLRVIGSDVRKDFLAHATKGRYGPWSLRGVDLDAQRGWLSPDGAGAQVEEAIRRLVKFQELNLKRGLFPAQIDVIFCRNVLLYFTPEDASKVFQEMADVTRPGGVLFVGYQDPRPTPADGWVPERLGAVEFFRPLPASASTDPPGLRSASRTSAPPTLGSATSGARVTSLPPQSSRPPTSVAGPRSSMPPASAAGPRSSIPPDRATPPADSLPPAVSMPPGVDDTTEPRVGPVALVPGTPARPRPAGLDKALDEARARAATGDVAGALDHLERLMEEYPEEVTPCVLAALLAEEAGDAQLVVRYSRRACFLAPDAVVPNLMMGFGLDALGQPDKARKYFRLAADGVKKVGDRSGALPDGEGLTARQVERMLDGRDE